MKVIIPPMAVPRIRLLAAWVVCSSLSSTTTTTATRGYQTNSMRSVQRATAAVMKAAVNSFRLLRTSSLFTFGWLCLQCRQCGGNSGGLQRLWQ